MIDIDSELIGITRNLSDCPDRKYFPDQNASFQCGAQTGKYRNGCTNNSKLCVDDSQKMNFTDCGLTTDESHDNSPVWFSTHGTDQKKSCRRCWMLK